MTHPDPTLDALLDDYYAAVRIGTSAAQDQSRAAIQSHLHTAVEQERRAFHDQLRQMGQSYEITTGTRSWHAALAALAIWLDRRSARTTQPPTQRGAET